MSGGARETLVRTMIEIIAEHGFDGLSVRRVASRAGVSIGAIQHHFPTKTAMLDAAMTAITSMAAQQSDELASVTDPAERLHALVELFIPADESDRVSRVWLAFTARATVDENTRNTYKHLWARVRNELRLLLAAASGNPEGAERSAHELLALLDGFTLSVIAEQQDSSTARRIAHERLDDLIRGNTRSG